MTKRTRIEELYKEGKEIKEIHKLTGFSYGYISNILTELRHPGSHNAAEKRWLEKSGWRQLYNKQYRRQWKKGHPKERSTFRRQVVLTHQQATILYAKNRWQEWTQREIEFLETHGQKMSIRQIALALGRTHQGVQQKAVSLKLDLRGDKMGARANRFKEIYRHKEAKCQEI